MGNKNSQPPVANQQRPPRAPASAGPSGGPGTNAREETGAMLNKKLTVDDFELLTVVGKGSFGKVMQVKKKDNGKIYAMKVLKKAHLVARKQVTHTQTERKVLENIDHPYIVSLRYAFQTPDKLYMILDFFNGGELFFHLKNTGRFPEKRARFYAAELLCALDHLHQHAVVYRDLKPENVLLDNEGHVRLTDFGLSKESVSADSLTNTFCGTPEYLAPEVIHGSAYGTPVDYWSLGTLLFEMLSGLPPFYNQNLHVMYEKIIRAKLTFPKYFSDDAKSLLKGLLDRDPKSRLGSGGVDEVKGHPFFAGIDWELLDKRQVPPDPEWVPDVKDAYDTSKVDEEFVSEPVRDTPAAGPGALANNPNFAGFTYEPDGVLDDNE